MTVTAKDLQFNISILFDLLSKGEEILITYRGKPKAKFSRSILSEVECIGKNNKIHT